MKDVYEVLSQKEFDLKRVQAEIEALRCVIPMLIDSAEAFSASTLIRQNKWPLEIDGRDRSHP
jgi:hypothetical protein